MMTKMMMESEDKPKEEPSSIALSDTCKDASESVSKDASKVLADSKKPKAKQQSRHSKAAKETAEVTAYDLQRVQRVYDRHPMAFRKWLQESISEEVRLLLQTESSASHSDDQSSITKNLFQQWMASSPLKVNHNLQ